jgi:hypothetical protein
MMGKEDQHPLERNASRVSLGQETRLPIDVVIDLTPFTNRVIVQIL